MTPFEQQLLNYVQPVNNRIGAADANHCIAIAGNASKGNDLREAASKGYVDGATNAMHSLTNDAATRAYVAAASNAAIVDAQARIDAATNALHSLTNDAATFAYVDAATNAMHALTNDAATFAYVDAATNGSLVESRAFVEGSLVSLPLVGHKTTAAYPSGEFAGNGNTLVGVWPVASNKDSWWWIPNDNATGFTSYITLAWLPHSTGAVWYANYNAVRNAGATGDYTDVNHKVPYVTNWVLGCNYVIVTNQWSVKANSTIEYLLNSRVNSVSIGTAVITRIQYRLTQ